MTYLARRFFLCFFVCIVLTSCGGPQNLLNNTSLSMISGGKDDGSQSSVVGGNDVQEEKEDGPIKVALLVPLSGTYTHVGQGLLDAAQMAVFDLGITHFELLPFDTKGTALGAVRAFKKAADEKVNLVLGPVFSKSAKAIAPLVYEHDINAIVFSNDSTLIGEGIFLLGISPEQQVRRVVDYALRHRHNFFAAVAPNNTYGAMVVKALRDQVQESEEGHVTKAEYYLAGSGKVKEYVRRSMRSLIRSSRQRLRVIELTQRLKELKKDIKEDDKNVMSEEIDGMAEVSEEVVELSEEIADEDTLLLATLDARSGVTIDSIVAEEFLDAEPDLRALLIAEGGQRLRDIVQRLKLYDLEQHQVQLLGSGQWDDDDELADTPLLYGALFASTPPKRRQQFEDRFTSLYDYHPARVSTLAYDGVALAAALAHGSSRGNFSFRAITNARGFMGIEGIFRFLPNGLNERGFAVLTVTEDGVEVVEESPSSFH